MSNGDAGGGDLGQAATPPDRLEAKIARLQSELKTAKRELREKARRKEKKLRTEETRKKIIIGGTLLALARDDGRWEGRLQELYAHVPRKYDREILGLPPRAPALPSSADDTQ